MTETIVQIIGTLLAIVIWVGYYLFWATSFVAVPYTLIKFLRSTWIKLLTGKNGRWKPVLVDTNVNNRAYTDYTPCWRIRLSTEGFEGRTLWEARHIDKILNMVGSKYAKQLFNVEEPKVIEAGAWQE